MTNPLPDPHHLCGDCRTRLTRINHLRTELAQLERAVAECAQVAGRYDPSPLVPIDPPAASIPELIDRQWPAALAYFDQFSFKPDEATR